jgi:phosphoesterase RecJ-like protein
MKYNYPQSKAIFKKIQDSNNILINVHKNPDCDTVGSATAMYEIVTELGKKATIVCPSEISDSFKFLKHSEKIQKVDFSRFNYCLFDLFLILDTSSYDRVTGSKEIELPDNPPKIIIDHHKTNNFQYPLQIVDVTASATAEILYKMIKDSRIKINEDIATALFSGITGDTVFFKYLKDPKTVFSIAADLLDKGANHKKLVSTFYDNNEFAFTKLLGLFLSEMKLEKTKTGAFVWAAISYETYARFGHPQGVRETAADSFFRSIKDTDFGIAMVETKKNELSVSFRSKDKIDVSVFAEKLGGGGHKNAAGCTVKGEFDESVKKVLNSLLT